MAESVSTKQSPPFRADPCAIYFKVFCFENNALFSSLHYSRLSKTGVLQDRWNLKKYSLIWLSVALWASQQLAPVDIPAEPRTIFLLPPPQRDFSEIQ